MSERISRVVEGIFVNAITPIILSAFILLFGLLRENVQISLQIIILIVLVYNTAILMRQNSKYSRQIFSPGNFVTDGTNNYVIDIHGKARLISDQATLFYLMHTLGNDKIETTETDKIVPIRGESVISYKEWEPPLSEEEKQNKQLRRMVGNSIEIVNFKYEPLNRPRIILTFKNVDDSTYQIISATYMGHKLPTDSIVSEKKSETKVLLPCQHHLKPGEKFDLVLELKQQWSDSDINTQKGNLGFVNLQVMVESKTVEPLYMI